MGLKNQIQAKPTPFLFVSGLDAEVAAWKAAVIAAAGSVSDATLAAVNTFMGAIKAAGLRSKILRCNLFCGTGIAAAKTPLIHDAGDARDSDFGTPGSGWTYVERGAGGGLNRNIAGGTSRCLYTGFIPATHLASDNSAHCAAYVVTGNTEASFAFGVQDAVPNDWALIGPGYSAVGSRGDCWRTGTAVPDLNGKGFYLVNRNGADCGLFKNGSLLQNTTAPGGNRIATYGLVFFGLNTTGTDTGSVRSSKTQAGYTIGTGLTTQNISDLNTAMQTFQTALTRNV